MAAGVRRLRLLGGQAAARVGALLADLHSSGAHTVAESRLSGGQLQRHTPQAVYSLRPACRLGPRWPASLAINMERACDLPLRTSSDRTFLRWR